TAPVHVSTSWVAYCAAAAGTRSLASARHSPSVDDARIGTVCTCTSRDSVPRYKSASAARCSPRSQRASAAAPTSSGKLSGRMSRSRTWLGATNFFGTLGRPRSRTSRQKKYASSPIATAASPQTSNRPEAATHSNSPRNHRAMALTHFHHPGSSLTGSRSFHLSMLTVRTFARFGSSATFSRAFSTSDRVGASPAGTNGASGCAATVSGARATSAASAILGAKRTPQLLLHVPGLELGAPVQVHRKARGHVERLEKRDHKGVRDGHRSLEELARRVEQHLEQVSGGFCWREPHEQRQHREAEARFGRRERHRHEQRSAALAAAHLLDAPPNLAERQTLELIDRLRERAPRRKAPPRPRQQELAAPDLTARLPELPHRRRLPEGGARQHEQYRAVEPRLGAEQEQRRQPARDLERHERQHEHGHVRDRVARVDRARRVLAEAHAEIGRLERRARPHAQREGLKLHDDPATRNRRRRRSSRRRRRRT